jgi:two-component system, NarL family, response regulator
VSAFADKGASRPAPVRLAGSGVGVLAHGDSAYNPAGSEMTQKNTTTTVMCVDDHRLVREGLTLIINRVPDLEVVAAASTGEEAVTLFERHHPDIVLMDLQLPRMSGIDAIKEIRRIDSSAHIIVLTVFQGEEDVHRALQVGASTYLLKDTVSDELIRVIREVREGEHPAQPFVEERLANRSRQQALSAREVQVLSLIAEGMRNREIGMSLGITEETVQVHVKHILQKLEVKDRSAAITTGIRRGIIHIS